jgi:hypothetical protein
MRLTLGQTDDCPLTTPSPLPSATVTSTVRQCFQLLVLSRRQTDDHVCFARAKGEDVDTGAGTQGPDGGGEGGRGIPGGLRRKRER